MSYFVDCNHYSSCQRQPSERNINMFDPLKMIRTAGVRRLEQADLAVPKNNIKLGQLLVE